MEGLAEESELCLVGELAPGHVLANLTFARCQWTKPKGAIKMRGAEVLVDCNT